MNRQQDVEARPLLSSFAVSDVRTVDRRGSAGPNLHLRSGAAPGRQQPEIDYSVEGIPVKKLPRSVLAF
jgi:hypothetical protein